MEVAVAIEVKGVDVEIVRVKLESKGTSGVELRFMRIVMNRKEEEERYARL